ncbi:MAG: SusC/RagA family TonB-linked outer membrane protein [Chitinophagaceae bacterium]
MRKLFMLLSMCLLVVQLWAQNKSLSGKVTDENGSPLEGVTVLVRKANLFAVTKKDGSFTISNVPASATELEFTFVGYNAQVVKIGSTTSFGVKMEPSINQNEGVIVTGVYKAKKAEYAGAAARVSGEAIKNVPVGSFDQMLQGRAPGVSILSGSGQPGSAANVTIRGQSSISGGSTPLYILDGIPVEAAVFQSINPNDFESVDVLKDAIAQSLYGSRGASGVIVATTKRGGAGKARVTYTGQFGVTGRPTFNYDMMNSEELLAAQERLGTILPASAAALPGWQLSQLNPTYVGGTPAVRAAIDRQRDSLKGINTNWDDIFFRQGTFSNNEIGISGGTGKTRFYSNLGYYSEQGIIDRSDMKRLTLRNNVDYSDDKLSLQLSSQLGYVKRNFQESSTSNSVANPFLATRLAVPYSVPFRADGSFASGAPQLDGRNIGPNLLDAMFWNKNYNDQLKAVVGLTATYKITDNIYAGGTVGIDFREIQGTVYSDPRNVYARTSTAIRTRSGSISESLTRFFQFTNRGFIGYRNTFKQNHEIDVTVYGEYIHTASKSLSQQGFGIDPKRPNTPAATQQGDAVNQLFAIVGGGKSQRKISSAFATAKYSFKQKYTFNFTYRYDGVSILNENNRFNDFYAAGFIWDATKEKFLANNKWINSLRARVSYGQSANSDNYPLGDFGYLPTYSQVSLNNGQAGIAVAGVGNPNARWEYTNTFNAGIDFSILKDRVYGNIEWYNKETIDLFVSKTLSATAGLGNGATQELNAGKLRNRGFEYVINYDVIKKRDLTWTLFANGAINRNQVVDLAGVPSYERGTELIKVGMPIGSHFNVRWAGVDAATGQALYYDLDGKVTNQFSASIRQQTFGTWQAPYTGGFGSRLRYKGFDFNILFSWQNGAYRYNNLEFFMENPGFLTSGYNQARSLNFWARPGDIATVQSPAQQNQFTSKYIQDAAFLRLRNVSIAYTVDREVLSKIKFIQGLRIFVNANNLLTFTNWKGFDPEDNNNISLSEFPNPRTITGGIEVKF